MKSRYIGNSSPRTLQYSGRILLTLGLCGCAGERPTFGRHPTPDAGGSGSSTDPGTSASDSNGEDGRDAGTHEGTADEQATDDATTHDAGGNDTLTRPQTTDDPSTQTADDAGSDDVATGSDGGLTPCGEADADMVACEPVLECAPGEYASGGTIAEPCRPCEAGSFSATTNAEKCVPWDDCGWLETSVAGTPVSNSECVESDKFYQFGTAAENSIHAMRADASGRVVVVGYSEGALYQGAEGSAFVRQYDSSGRISWTHQFGAGTATGVAVDGEGNTVVAGYTDGAISGDSAGSLDAFVRRYSATGEVLWTRQFGTDGIEYVYSIASSLDGASVVVGSTSGTLSETNRGDTDAFVRKYSSTGDTEWTRQFGTLAGDQPMSVAVSAKGLVAIAGETWGDLSQPSAGYGDAFLRVYAADGGLLWATQFGTSSGDGASSVAFTPDGNVVVAGNSSGSLDGPTAGNIDGFLRLYTNAGILSWSQQLGSDEEDRIEAVTVSHTGDITVAGYTSGSLFIANLGAYDIFLRKFESSGQLLWSRQLGTDEGDFAVAVASLGLGDRTIIAGSTRGSMSGEGAGLGDALVGIVQAP